ncbi:hypothetical protein DMP12_06085 [Gordonibacter urolithinfaciens]|uniref:Uncharacterized protein n=1 Tax=Gordonibacter urolithinfaciens TaxID=1335613 RepID=A0A423ULI4_9ACTN|nr:hypothetical protein DMP12_06085 [Gordonibacter urolithinfaciens]
MGFLRRLSFRWISIAHAGCPLRGWGRAQSLGQSCSRKTPTGRFGSCGTRLVGTAPSPELLASP